jgi:hypothetical protein
MAHPTNTANPAHANGGVWVGEAPHNAKAKPSKNGEEGRSTLSVDTTLSPS